MSQKIALVTGASRGIGLAISQALTTAGYRVALHYRTDSALAQKISEDLPGSMTFQADLSEANACQDLVKRVKDAMGDVDVLVNNAGMSIDQVITFAKPDDFDRLLATNLKPVFNLSKLVSRGMIRRKAGSIINITSIVGHTGNGGQSMYVATKAAITGFTNSIAVDLAGFGIRCNTVAPGFIDTEMTSVLDSAVKEAILSKIPLKRLGTAKEVAQAVVFLASEQASYITGTTIHVNGGMHRC